MEFEAPHFCTLAIHRLIHPPEECLRFGTIEIFSCFKYENTVKYLKLLNQSQKEPLIHLTKKLHISSTFTSNISRSGARIDKAWKPITDSPYTTEQIQLAQLQTKKRRFSIDEADNYFGDGSRVRQLQSIVGTTEGSYELIFNNTLCFPVAYWGEQDIWKFWSWYSWNQRSLTMLLPVESLQICGQQVLFKASRL